MIKNRAGWLAVSVLAIATLLMVFFVMPRLSKDEQPIGDAINAAGRDVQAAVTEGGDAARKMVDPTPATPVTPPAQAARNGTNPVPAPSASPTPATASSQQAVQQPSQPAAKQALVVPTFDVLRVEPDGSAVVAGRAEPKARIEVADAAKTVATSQVDKAGEFVAILDAPLPPGDHQLVLKVTAEDGRTIISEEIATVSVPKTRDGELLAMVAKPGTASRIMAMPTTGKPAKTERVALAGSETVVAQQPQQAVQPTVPVAPTPQPTQLTTGNGAPPVPATPAQPVETASAPSAAGATTDGAQSSATAKPDLQVSAVEIEGDRIFIAGISKPGNKLRGYADGAVVGETQAGTDGNFVIDGRQALSIGQHRIAVDHIGPRGDVVLRVEVPFDRPAGEQVAAVASPDAGASQLTPIDGGAFDRLRNEVSRAFQLLNNLYANGATPSAEEVAAARSATTISLRSLTEYRLPLGTDANAMMIAEMTLKDAAAALSALEALPRDVAGLGKGLGSVSELIARVVGPILPNGTVAPLPEAVAAAQAVTPAPVAASGQAGAQVPASPAAPKTIAQAPLTQSEAASVIIRRGDTLWQISRRVYGQGVRYTTIYLANQDQINNPNRIEPGQIFGVPKDAMPDGEAEQMHRKLNKS